MDCVHIWARQIAGSLPPPEGPIQMSLRASNLYNGIRVPKASCYKSMFISHPILEGGIEGNPCLKAGIGSSRVVYTPIGHCIKVQNFRFAVEEWVFIIKWLPFAVIYVTISIFLTLVEFPTHSVYFHPFTRDSWIFRYSGQNIIHFILKSRLKFKINITGRYSEKSRGGGAPLTPLVLTWV